ncbi:MAG: DNA-directed RNA polymerase subunit beta' [Gemmatimonadetes bacterium]|nr:MAG: DNA-directed RNA polymerase subunit beta' [Gemmatimonadota bacterium]
MSKEVFVQGRNQNLSEFSAIRLRLASPDVIREQSFGEVTKPETINYRSFKPERDGLFCERIFGPVKDWECSCGKYKRMRYRGVICDRCGVEVTLSKVRRERLGHIDLAVPVAHIWYVKGLPSRVGNLLDMSVRDLERVLYYESYYVIDPGEIEGIAAGELLSEDEYYELSQQYDYRLEEYGFVAEMGAPALKKMLQAINLEELATDLQARLGVESSEQQKKKILKRLKIVKSFLDSGNTPEERNKPEWMILEMIPVIPPDLRPLVALEGGRFATSDLNDLYRRVINRNNRLKKLIEIQAPEVILRNEKRMLQEAVDALFDNGRRSRAVRGHGNRPLKSLSEMLKGKQGRFRQNLLGKRVDYSGRSVIVVGPELEMHQCGLPKAMALELFKPFIIRQLESKGHVQTVKSAKRLVERETTEVWDILEEIIADHPVFLNRAPTLHRLGIQAFEPVLVEGKAIRLHPLVCAAFNADFDGDQMAVHVPLGFEAQLEARVLMLSTFNILSPANGRPLATPSQDIVIGPHYMTKIRKGGKGEGRIFASTDEAVMAHAQNLVELHSRIKIKGINVIKEDPSWTENEMRDPNAWQDYTTVGRVLFNQIIPEGISFQNKELKKKELAALVGDVYRQYGPIRTAQFLDRLKEIGFEYATRCGLTVGVEDMIIPETKQALIDKARTEIEEIQRQYDRGVITDGERYNKVIDTWTHTTSDVAKEMFREMELSYDGFNPIYMMADSGARGSREQVRQLAGMRGLMAKPQKKITGSVGEIIETPILSSFREGLTVLEYFISTHGARKGLADTALKTADAGYLTRRLVDVAQDAIITEEDCGTVRGIDRMALKEGEEVIVPLKDRILGRVALDDVVDPITDEIIVNAGTEIDETAANMIEDANIERVRIRSVLTCETRRGICVKCYGRNLATGRMVEVGEAVGIIAAQSIGEPGTQLTLRTFHIGGTAARIAAQSQKTVKSAGKITYEQLDTVTNKAGKTVAITRNGVLVLTDRNGRESRYAVPYGAMVMVSDGQDVGKNQVIFEWDPYADLILADISGEVRFVDIEEGITVREELDESTGLRQMVIVEDRERQKHPHIQIMVNGERQRNYAIPIGAHILVHDGDKISAGDLLVKIPGGVTKTRDITGGLPRVAELFEARKPKDCAVVTEVDGRVVFGDIVRGMRKIIIQTENELEDGTKEERVYHVPYGKHLRVHEGDRVEAGMRLSEGPVNPHDILRIKGEFEVQEYLLNEIQEVYRLQGVGINDKHIGVIVRQMLQKVQIENAGDTNFLEGERVDKFTFREENEKVMAQGGVPATAQPVLLGITKAALSTESFVSAASFQETTRVLTEAAIEGRRDNLLGLMENVIMGHLIPAGTGVGMYRSAKIVEKNVAPVEPAPSGGSDLSIKNVSEP